MESTRVKLRPKVASWSSTVKPSQSLASECYECFLLENILLDTNVTAVCAHAGGTQPKSNGVTQVLSMLWSPLESSPPLRKHQYVIYYDGCQPKCHACISDRLPCVLSVRLTLRVAPRESSSLPPVPMPPCLSWVSIMRNMTIPLMLSGRIVCLCKHAHALHYLVMRVSLH